MAVTVKKDLEIKFLIPNIQKSFVKKVAPVAKNVILSTILAGISPVTGRRFAPYTAKYAAKKGQKRPVDMFLTGKMINSFRVRKSGKGEISFVFTDFKASIHNDGEGKQPVRKLLPTNKDDEFTAVIENTIQKAIDKLVDNEILKQNT